MKCEAGEPLIGAKVELQNNAAGIVTAGAVSPFLGYGIGIVRLNAPAHKADDVVSVGCKDGSMQQAELVQMPFYDELAEIPRGKRVDIPQRPWIGAIAINIFKCLVNS